MVHTQYMSWLIAGYEVIVIDNLLTGFKEAVHPQAKFYGRRHKGQDIP